MAHDLNSQPLPLLPESFEVVRLPPAHQRLAEVNFDIVPDSQLVLGENDEDDDDDSSQDGEEDAEGGGGGQANGGEGGDDDGDEDEDEDMEEVGVEDGTGPGTTPVQAAPIQEREMDEDYDV